MNLYTFLAAGIDADRAAVCFDLPGTNNVTYGELADRAGRVAARLVADGVVPGDRVLLMAHKTIESVMTYLGVLKAGAVVVPVNTSYTDSELKYFEEDAEPRLFVRDAAGFVDQCGMIEPLVRPVERANDDLAALVYTSGTTGKPKGAMLTHGGLAANAEALVQLWQFTAADKLLHALPIFHIHGLFVALHCALRSGCAMLWMEKYDASVIIDELPRCSVMMGVPTFYTRLLDEAKFTRGTAEKMRLFVSGSAPMLEATFAEFEARTGHKILERYGMSEASIITSNPYVGERRAGTVGFAVPGYDVRVRGEQPGMIEIKGPSLFTGYWHNPLKTADEFTEDGYFMTGDLGVIDGEGRVSITGRAKDLIISGGFNVYPKEVELVLDLVPGVIESAVIGVPHPDFGEAVVAVVAGDLEEALLVVAARGSLAAYKVPKRVIIVPELPRNAMGKVQKAELRKQYSGLF